RPRLLPLRRPLPLRLPPRLVLPLPPLPHQPPCRRLRSNPRRRPLRLRLRRLRLPSSPAGHSNPAIRFAIAPTVLSLWCCLPVLSTWARRRNTSTQYTG